jgi:hypothetical protein
MDTSAAIDVLDYIVWLVCLCLSGTPMNVKHPVYDVVLSTLEILAELASDSALHSAPGLLDVLQAAQPPSVAYLKSLPLEFYSYWGVYLLVLEKRGCRPKIYIGSGIASTGGVQTRFYAYDKLDLIPKYVQAALDEGYRISHKGLLCWCLIPTSLISPRRVLFLAIEATLSAI